MEYTKRRRYTVKQDDRVFREMYPHDVQFYKVPPSGELSLKDFQDFGLERRQVLQLVESTSQRTDLKSVEERKIALLNALRKDGYNYFAKLLNGQGCSSHTDFDLEARRRDHVSHYILRLAYCRNMELRGWFVNAEVEYLKMRFTSLNKEGILKLLTLNDFDYRAISQEEKEELREKLHVSTAKVSAVDHMEFYRVPFERVWDLIKGRRVYVNNGFAYIPLPELVSLFVSEFKILLNKELEIATEYVKTVEDDDRLSCYLKNLPNVFAGMTKVIWSTTAVPIESLDELSKISYPLCMRMLHEALKTNHHLRFTGRMHYGLFMKGIGVTLEDALRFWRTEFTKSIDLEEFQKKYSYDIQHYYGAKGKRVNYTPYGCNKILSTAPGPGEKHGCPFKHMNNDDLKKKLGNYGIPPSAAREAAELAKEGSYNLACTKCFEVTHKILPDRPILHPNSYFSQSREIITKSISGTDTSWNNGEKNSQSIKTKTDKLTTTPSRNIGAPVPNIITPTSKGLLTKIEPLNIEEMLNADVIDEMMADM